MLIWTNHRHLLFTIDKSSFYINHLYAPHDLLKPSDILLLEFSLLFVCTLPNTKAWNQVELNLGPKLLALRYFHIFWDEANPAACCFAAAVRSSTGRSLLHLVGRLLFNCKCFQLPCKERRAPSGWIWALATSWGWLPSKERRAPWQGCSLPKGCSGWTRAIATSWGGHFAVKNFEP